MGSLPISFLFSIVFLFLHPHSTISKPPLCDKRYCGSGVQVPIEFPFQLKEPNNNESERCGYPGFELCCNHRKQAVLTLPNAGEFVVKYISLKQQRVWINDPDECLPKRFMQSIDLTNSPFIWGRNFHNFQSLIFLNCSKSAAEDFAFDPLQRVPCMSDDKYLIIYMLNSPLDLRNSSCYVVGSASVPVKDGSQQPRLVLEGLHSDVVLQWIRPLCGQCEVGQQCGFLSDTGLDITCYNDSDGPREGESTGAEIIAVGIFLFLLIVGPVGFFICKRIRLCQQQERTDRRIESNTRHVAVAVAVGRHDAHLPGPSTRFAPRP